MNGGAIGIFDSGVGGLTVARAVLDQLPHESIHYIGDTANSPYGPRSLDDVAGFSLAVMDRLVAGGVKMLVIACNTATAAVLPEATARYSALGIPVLGVIDPAVRRAVATTRNRHIAVIGTSATIASGAYQDAIRRAAPDMAVSVTACPRFVEFVEAGITSGPELLDTAQRYLAPITASGADTVVLGCTHYPLLTGAISYALGPDVVLVSSAEETAQDVYRTLIATGLGASTDTVPTHEFASTGSAEAFLVLARRFLGPEVSSVHALSAEATP